jgi:hypothetical protein
LALVKSFTEYFKSKTADLGNCTVFLKQPTRCSHNGDALQMDDFMRVSAVITSDTGKGYAKQLVAYTANAILTKQNSFLTCCRS